MKYPKFFALIALIALVCAPMAFAQTADVSVTAATADQTITTDTTPVVSSDQLSNVQFLSDELTSYQLKAADPDTGFFTRLILRAKIHQLQNELNIQIAIQ